MKMTSVLLLMILCFRCRYCSPRLPLRSLELLLRRWWRPKSVQALDREAHCPGYQQGYHGEPENIETAKFSPSE